MRRIMTWMSKSRLTVYLGAALLTLWFVWAWLRLLPPPSVRRTLYHGVNRLIPIHAHIGVSVTAPHHQTTPLFRWQFLWRHVIVIPPQLKVYHQWAYAHLAYSDIVSLYGAHQLYTHALPYFVTPIEYPVLMGVFMWLMAWVPTVTGYFLVTGVFVWAAALGIYRWLWHRNRRLALAFASTPLLLVYGLLNWDIVGIFLMIMAIDRYEQRRYSVAAVLFAVAVFFKFFPIFYLPFVAVDLRRNGKSAVLRRMVGIFLGSSAVINGPFIVGNWWNWSIFYVFNASRGFGADLWSNHWIHLTSVPLIDTVSLLAVLVAMALTGWRVGRGMSPYEAAAVVFAVFLIVNKVYSPQYTVWMVAFAMVAAWPVWSVAVLSMAGLMDYVNSFTVLKLMNQGTGGWYAEHVFPWGIAARYLALATTLGGVMAARWRRSHRISDDGTDAYGTKSVANPPG